MMKDSLNDKLIGSLRTQIAVDSVTILRQDVLVQAQRQRADSALALVGIREQQIKLYADNEKVLRKQIKRAKVKQVFTGLAGVAIAVLALVLK